MCKTKIRLYVETSISGPTDPEMLAFWQAFQKLRTDGQTEQRFMYIDDESKCEMYHLSMLRILFQNNPFTTNWKQ